MSLPPRFRSDLWRRLAAAQDTFQEQLASPGESLQDLARSVARLTAERVAAPRVVRWFPKLAAGFLVAAAAATTMIVMSHRDARSLASAGAGSMITSPPTGGVVPARPDGQPFVADARSDLPLQFSDGSSVTFRAGSAGRMQRLTGSGAEIVLERGRLDAHVIHADKTLWLIHAGPYRVRVTGTRFAMVWVAPAFQVELFEGAVIVDGSLLGAGVPLRAGHRLKISSGVVLVEPIKRPAEAPAPTSHSNEALFPANDGTRHVVSRAGDGAATVVAVASPNPRDGDLQVAGVEDGDRAAPRSGAADSRADRPSGAEPEPSATLSSLSPGDLSRQGGGAEVTGHGGTGAASERETGISGQDDRWLVLAERRDYRASLVAAKRLGWNALCRRLDARHLLTLGDVARYSGAHAKARQAFRALVTRFPNDRLAADAVFSLGRLAFEGRRPVEATRWFGRYVADWPEAPLADQATGRLLECAIRTDDREAARGAATRYLARAPKGPHASLAREVLEQPVDGIP